MSENLDSEQRGRLWEHRLHVENLFYSRLTSFLTIQVILLAVVGALYSKNSSPIFILRVIGFLGILLTCIWFFAQLWHKQTLDILLNRARDCLPEYKVTMIKIEKEGGWLLRHSKHPLFWITYIIPLLVVFMWVILLLFLFQKLSA